VTPTVYFWHDALGTVDALGPLAAGLHPRLRAIGVERRPGPPPNTLPELVADHLSGLRRVHRGGAWNLIGWSFGGLLAYEAARQLTRAGEAVGVLTVLDTASPDADAWEALDAATRCATAGSEGAAWEALAAQLPASVREAIPPPERVPHKLGRALGKVVEHVRLLAGYRPTGRVRVGQPVCVGASSSGPEVLGGWADWFDGPVTFRSAPGDHRSILRQPLVAVTIELLHAALNGQLREGNPS
jgi:thioesterase domain-containing protein